jgi:uncharacterized membrane protein
MSRQHDRLLKAVSLVIGNKYPRPPMKKDQITGPFFNRINANYKLLFSVVVTICIFALLLFTSLHLLTSLMISWDAFNLVLIIISWITFFKTSSQQLSVLAGNQDETLPASFIIVLISLCFSFFGTIVLLMFRDSVLINKQLHTVVSLIGIALSWILLHTMFTLRYAHLYFILDDKDKAAGGIDFPNETNPDYIDFAYFSFTIGMTFQVSDVTTSSKRIRRFVLVHSLIAFVFNTLIVALTINTIASLK